MKRLLFFGIASFLFAACNDDMPAPSADIATFTNEIEGQWVSSEISIVPVAKKQSVSIFPLNNYSCNLISSSFQKKDVVSKFTVAVKGTFICVTKTYTCSLPPEHISWVIEPSTSHVATDDPMVGKDFVIKEINEGVVQASYKVLFFNYDPSEKATPSNANQLWLEVTYDSKEASSVFLVKLKKVKS